MARRTTKKTQTLTLKEVVGDLQALNPTHPEGVVRGLVGSTFVRSGKGVVAGKRVSSSGFVTIDPAPKETTLKITRGQTMFRPAAGLR